MALGQFDVRELAKLESITELEYAREIVLGIDERQTTIDEEISSHLKEWTINRLFPVDRAILRLGVWEILYSDTPNDAARAEALALAEEYGSDDATRFIGGLLGAIARDS